jgi:(E)-4-hydroxy-3-methylbut-2-enyl-diphosphate synthase
MKTKEVRVGGVGIGGGNPVRVQSMCNTPTKDVKATVAQIKALEAAGCELVRVAVPDMESAKALSSIKKQIKIPLIADVHFDYQLALAAIPSVDKLRINPGTMPKEKLKEVIEAAKKKGIPIRVGINAASMEKNLTGSTVERMIASVEGNIKMIEGMGLSNIIVALKSSDVLDTIEAYRRFSAKHSYPLHIGLTESGFGIEGAVKSAVALGVLLEEGIGDTIRVSLTGDPVQEVEAAYDILSALGLRQKPGVSIISCPTCARCSVELEIYAKEVKQKLALIKKPLKVAVMGCEVNGPGEAKHADFGLAFSKGQGHIFMRGEIVKQVSKGDAVDTLVQLIRAKIL